MTKKMEFRTDPVATPKWPNSLIVTAWHSGTLQQFSPWDTCWFQSPVKLVPEAKQKVEKSCFSNLTTVKIRKLKFKAVHWGKILVNITQRVCIISVIQQKLIKYKIKIRPIGGKKDLNRNILIDLELSDICFKITMISMCYGNRELGDEVLLREL